jgi:integrase/recombinase XerD
MRIFRQQWRDSRTGRTGVSRKWYLEFKDHHDRTRRLAGFTDKGQTSELGRRVERLVTQRILDEAPSASMLRWLEHLPPSISDRLASLDLIDSVQHAARKPLDMHIEDFRTSLVAKGVTGRHVELVTGRIRRVRRDCGFTHLSDIDAGEVELYLHTRRQGGLSNRTSNFYLQAVKQFCRWLVREERLSRSPVDRLDPVNARIDQRRARRALTAMELADLLKATADAPTRYGLSGPERALLYRLAVCTGLRRGELASLTPSSFEFGNSPTVVVAASYSKRRRRDTLPLRADLAAILREHVEHLLSTEPILSVPSRHKTAEMIRADLRAASIPSKGADGRVVDFHALRHTFITNLARSGVHPKVAQTLARHCTISLTLDHYTHLDEDAGREAVEQIPA